jgi:competence protein ComGC
MQPKMKCTAMTLVEVVLVSVLLTVLAMAAVAYVRQPGERVKNNACSLQAARLQALVDQYRLDLNRLPSGDMQELRAPRYIGGPLPVCPLDGRSYSLDARTGQVISHSH